MFRATTTPTTRDARGAAPTESPLATTATPKYADVRRGKGNERKRRGRSGKRFPVSVYRRLATLTNETFWCFFLICHLGTLALATIIIISVQKVIMSSHLSVRLSLVCLFVYKAWSIQVETHAKAVRVIAVKMRRNV